jgi:alanine racemase
MARVAPALMNAGCKTFFVALMHEGLALRALLPDAQIQVFNGTDTESAPAMAAAGLIPVLNHPGQIEAWHMEATRLGKPLPAMIHADTGMTRLGLNGQEIKALVEAGKHRDGLNIGTIMSHLACADDADHSMNAHQLENFQSTLKIMAPLGDLKASLANSSAIFLGDQYHFDLTRPGSALYGITPHGLKDGASPNPMAQVITLQGKILQIRGIDRPSSVGYGATHQAEKGQKIAIVGVGYADGYLRSLSNSATATLGGIRVPVVGRVSMDLITLDVTNVPDQVARPGALVELIGPDHSVDALAREAGTIGYEILTALGPRFHRHYLETA